MVKLFAQLALVDQLGQSDRSGAVDQAEGDTRIGPVPKDRLAHQQFVEIGVDERPDDRIDLPFVIIDARGDIDHGVEPPTRC